MPPDTALTPEGILRYAVRKTFLSLRTRNYRLFFIGQLISNTGNSLTNITLTLLVLHLGGNGVSAGLLAAVFGRIAARRHVNGG